MTTKIIEYTPDGIDVTLPSDVTITPISGDIIEWEGKEYIVRFTSYNIQERLIVIVVEIQ